MVNEHSLNIDELVNRCRNEQAKQHIAEAIACYKVNAFRSCIIATWLAIVFDYIDKLRELADLGNTKANIELTKLEDIQRKNNLPASLNFEKELLEIAKKEFQLISPLEQNELNNLHKTRHLCAHPSMNLDEKIYQPTQALTLHYIEIAVESFLRQPAISGNEILERILREVNSINFPDTQDSVIEHFKLSPLSKARESLIRSFVICLLKTLLRDELDSNNEKRHTLAFNAVWRMYPTITEKALKERLNELMLSLKDEKFEIAIKRLREIDDYGKFIQNDVRALRRNCFKRMFLKDPTLALLIGLKDERQRRIIVKNLKKMGIQQLINLVKTEPYADFVPHAVELYLQSTSWESANKLGTELIIPLAKYLTAEYIETIIKGMSENEKLKSSFKAKNVLICIESTNIISEEEFNNLIKKYSLEEKLS
jgi:hypothetical protein